MIAEYLNKATVLEELRKVRLASEERLRQARASGAPPDETDQSVIDELTKAEERETVTSSGQLGFEPVLSERRGAMSARLDDFAFISHDPIISLLQSALEESAYRHPEEIDDSPPRDDARRGVNGDVMVTANRLRSAPEPSRGDGGRRIFEKFSTTDANFVRSKLAEGIRYLRGKHAFCAQPARPIDIPARSRLILVGDWGSGLPRAQKVARQIRAVLEEGKAQNLTQHVIHLGDVYYSGWAHEYRRRFLPFWPVKVDEASTIGSWALNSNHDMYSGGYGFFDLLLADPRFEHQEQSSFFMLRHPNWNILGLDTAWEDGLLHGPQLNWIAAHFDDHARETLLLSHHQFFSAYESASSRLQVQLDALLTKRQVKAWFWGHEHRCVAYSPFNNVVFGRCVGHGGIPVYMWHGTEDAYPTPAIYEDRRCFSRGFERWAVFGFVVLEFDGPRIDLRYVDENGQVARREVIA